MKYVAAAACAAFALALVCAQSDARVAGHRASGGAGSLDPSFGTGGEVALSTAFEPQALLVQPNGALLVAASTQVGASEIMRFQPTGQIDGSFGSSGVATLGMSVVASLALQTDGKIVAAGRTSSGSAQVARLATDGSADTSFGRRGVVNFAFASSGILSSAATTVLVQPDGKLVVGGLALAASSDLYYTSLARFKANGSPDTTFGAGGFVAEDLVGGITALGLQRDGKIVVCGGFISPAQDLVVRFLSDGTLDGSVAGGGALTAATHDPLLFEGTNIFQPDLKVVQWSKASDGSKTEAQVARVLRTFAPDPSFKSAPFAFGSPSSCCNAPNDVEVQPDGKLLVGGYAVGTSGNAEFGLARLLPGGGFDRSFGRAGRVVTQWQYNATITVLAIQPDGNILAAGVETQNSTTWLLLARYLGS
jgi:uncharacterized delta-60 repeat protein